ncbi:MAG: enoyl-CoA hydratase/isomerase family protein, partial [Hyphomonadaceae bacterium]
VHALAAGGGVSVAAAADFVLSAPDAKYYAAFLGIGISPDTGASYFLPRRMGTRRATEFLMRNQTLSAREALEAGLITRIVDADKLADEARALAQELAGGPTLAYGELKNLLLSSSTNMIEGQLEAESRALTRMVRTDDCWNALHAVLAKKKAVFEGR